MARNRARSVCSWVLFTARLSSEAEVALDNDNDNDNKEFIDQAWLQATSLPTPSLTLT